MTIEVALADANALMLSALSEIIENDTRFSLMSTTSSAESFLQTALMVPCSTAVIDWSIPTLGGEKLLRELRDNQCRTRVIVSSHARSDDIAKRAMASGAAGFFSHSEESSELLDAIVEVAAGKMVFPYLDVRELQDPFQSLTKTEKLLLSSLAQGHTNKELASEHNISINTVKFHLRNLYEKLAVRNRSQAVAFYYSSLDSQATHS